MTNALSLTAPKYVAPADWNTSQVNLGGGLPVIKRTGLYVTIQATLDAIITTAIASGTALVYLDIAPMGFTSGPMQNPNAYYPTPAMIAEMIAQARNVVPNAGAELTAAENTTGTVTALPATTGGAGTITVIPGSQIVVPVTSRPVTLEFQASFVQTAVGTGTAFLSLYETTGTATQLAWASAPLPNSIALANSSFDSPFRQKRLGAISSSRSFELRAYVYNAASSSATVSVANSTGRPTMLRAVAG